MDSSNVLTALEELEKWRARRVKIEERLAAIRAQRTTLQAELEGVGRELTRLAESLFEPREGELDPRVLRPFQLER